MSKRNDLLLLEDIVESCEKIQKYVYNLDYNEFINDDKTIDAVIRNFEIIGEAANNLSQDLFNKYPFIRWSQIIGMRNRLIHGYFGVDYQIIWQVINENINDLKEQMKKILRESK
jgi:uncharacterized protein with HEPN domain